jgi:hypothetical protein
MTRSLIRVFRVFRGFSQLHDPGQAKRPETIGALRRIAVFGWNARERLTGATMHSHNAAAGTEQTDDRMNRIYRIRFVLCHAGDTQRFGSASKLS